MTAYKKMKEKVKSLKNEIIAIYYAYKNPDTKLFPKIIILFTLGYALSPIDLIPDFIPVLGYLDDLIVIPALIALSLKMIPKKIIDESRIKAMKKPLKLKKNWYFASIFILVWIMLILVIVNALIKLFIK